MRQDDELVHIEGTFRSESFNFDTEQSPIVTVQEKKCSKCGAVKPIEAFSLQQDRYRKTGRRSRCKECEKLAKRSKIVTPEQRKRWREKWLDNLTPEQRIMRSKKSNEKRREKGQDGRRAMLQYRYNITIGEYEQMVQAQEGVCAICGDPPDQEDRLVIDHDHISGIVRALLCRKCNLGIGYFKEDTSRLESAMAYLQRFAIDDTAVS